MNKNRSKQFIDSDDLSFEDDCEENGFISTVTGPSLSSFSFSDNETEILLPDNSNRAPSPDKTWTNDLPDNRKGRACPNGITPPVD
ncbi:MAG: hypothetical protein ABRQ27_17465, partial [Clostridiaceae bacterium]